jgi:enoyl-CoA hydratase/carnithine racemase
VEGGVLRVERAGEAGEVALFVLDRPAVRNAINDELLNALLASFGAVAAEASASVTSVRAVVLCGSGLEAFSAGMDLRERASFSDERLREQHARIASLLRSVRELPVPVIAAVEGFALGGGFELLLACDLVVASSSASFALPEVRVGIIPGNGGARLLAWAVGDMRARDLVLTGRRLGASEAAEWGLVTRVVRPGEALGWALELAASLAAGAPLAVRAAKAAVRNARPSLASGAAVEDALYETVLRSEDRREGFSAFVEKRPPRFRGQ